MGDSDQLQIKQFRGAEIGGYLEQLAALRIEVFKEWPYLYEGSLEYERQYLSKYASNQDSILLVVLDGNRAVGASTGTPMDVADAEFMAAFAKSDFSISSIFYLGESVLLPEYRGRGIGHRFFEAREEHARQLGAQQTAFCAVERSEEDPRLPEDFRPLDAFWQKRGYVKHSDIQATFNWREVGNSVELAHTLNFWIKDL